MIATTCCLGASVPQAILRDGEDAGEEEFIWWYNIFGEDFYIELLRHNLEENKRVNEVLLRFASKYDVKVIASNDVYYLNQEDANAHDILICVKENELQSTPIGRGRGFRYGFPNQEYYFKSQDEMKSLFRDIPEAIENINELVNKIEKYQLDREVAMPS